MILLVAVIVSIALIVLVSARFSRGAREHRWTVRHEFDLVHAYGAAEAAGYRIRDMSLLATSEVRRRTFVRGAFQGLFLAGVPLLLFYFAAPWWVAAPVITLTHGPSLISMSTLTALRNFNSAQDTSMRSGIGFTIGALAFAGTGFTALWLAVQAEEQGLFALIWAPLIVGAVALLATAAAVATFARRYASGSAAIIFGADASSADSLFLRSFNDDNLRFYAPNPNIGNFGIFSGFRVRFEELIASFLQKQGRLIAIGKPGEKLPQLGAIRTYVSDDDWKTAVTDTVTRVGSILLVAGSTEGLRFEIDHLSGWQLLHKTLILLPPVGERDSQKRFFALSSQLGITFTDTTAADAPWMSLVFRTMTAIGLSKTGRLVIYVSNGRDWPSYAATLTASELYIRGRKPTLEHGMLARAVGLDVELEPQ